MEGPRHCDRLDVPHHVDRPVRGWSDRSGRGVPQSRGELGGSEYLRLRKAGGGAVPTVDPSSLRVSLDHLRSAIENGTVAACHDLSHGGLAIAAAEMCLGGDLGADLKTTAMDPMRWDVQLFS